MQSKIAIFPINCYFSDGLTARNAVFQDKPGILRGAHQKVIVAMLEFSDGFVKGLAFSGYQCTYRHLWITEEMRSWERTDTH
jgi:hypothetical protein